MIDIYNGDCIKVMDELIAKGIKVDLVLTDLPFGTSACKWDIVIPFEEMWDRINRITKKETPVVLFGVEPFSSALRMSNLKEYKYDWIYEKPNGANFLSSKYQPLKVHEVISVFGKMATSYSKKGNLPYYPQMEKGEPYKCKSGKQKNKKNNSSVRTEIKQVVTENEGYRYPRSIQRFDKDKEKFHPTQKPIKLLEYLIRTYTKEGALVLDFCMGSGSCGVACKNTGRNFIGIELDKKYFDIAKERLNNE